MPFRSNRFQSNVVSFDMRQRLQQNRWRRNRAHAQKQPILALKDESISIYPNLKVRTTNRQLNRNSPVRLHYKNFTPQGTIPKIRINTQIEDDSVNVIEPGDQEIERFSLNNASALKRVIQNQPKNFDRIRMHRAAARGMKRLGSANTALKRNVRTGDDGEKRSFSATKIHVRNRGLAQSIKRPQRVFGTKKNSAKVFQTPTEAPEEDEEMESIEDDEDLVESLRSAGPSSASTFLQQRLGAKSGAGGLWAVKVANLPSTVSREDIEQLFKLIGSLKEARFIRRGLAIAVYAAKSDALKAYRTYNNREIDGVPMRVEVVPYVVGDQQVTNSSVFQPGAATADKSSTNPKPNRDLINSVIFSKKSAGPAVTFTVKV